MKERNNFGKKGWAGGVYQFGDKELHDSSKVIAGHLETSESIKYDQLQYMIGEIVYGGRVMNDWDRRLMMAITKSTFTAEIESQGK